MSDLKSVLSLLSPNAKVRIINSALQRLVFKGKSGDVPESLHDYPLVNVNGNYVHFLGDTPSKYVFNIYVWKVR